MTPSKLEGQIEAARRKAEGFLSHGVSELSIDARMLLDLIQALEEAWEERDELGDEVIQAWSATNRYRQALHFYRTNQDDGRRANDALEPKYPGETRLSQAEEVVRAAWRLLSQVASSG